MENYRLMDGQALGFVYRLNREAAIFERYVGGGEWEHDPSVVKHHLGLAQDYTREDIGADLSDWLEMFDARLAAQ